MSIKEGDNVIWPDNAAHGSVSGTVVFINKEYICIRLDAETQDHYRGASGKSMIEYTNSSAEANKLGNEPRGYGCWGIEILSNFKVVKKAAKAYRSSSYAAADGSGRTKVFVDNPETTAFEFL